MVEYNDQAEQTADEIKQLYDRASRHVQIEAEKIFTKYQEQYHLSYRQARNLLNRIHDPTDIKAIIEQLKKDPNNEELAKQLESQAYGARLQRLANLQAQIDSIMLSIFAEEQRRSRQLYINLAEEAYYKAIFDLQQYTGYGFEFKTLSRKNIERILNTKWYGGNFSEHIWGNTEQLAERLKQELILNMLTGRPLRRANLAIEKRFQTGYHNARRLVRTESTYISSQLHKEAYESCGVKKYIYVAILDLKTSEICKSLDKKSFLLSKAISGINFQPKHPFCRSTIIAWVPLSLLAKMKQSAIDPATGKRITVPGDMTYGEWYKKFVDGKTISNKIQRSFEYEQYEKYRKTFKDEFPDSFEKYRQMKYNDSELWNQFKSRYRSKNYLQERLDYIEAGEKCFIPRYTKFASTPKVIAGKGSSVKLRVAQQLSELYGGTPEEWSKKVAKIKSSKYTFDVHWYERDGKQYEVKVKVRKENEKN